jgi:Protein of unknown function with HXXEE motif
MAISPIPATIRGRLARPRIGLHRALWLFPAALAVHVLEESAGFTEWVNRNASDSYTDADFAQINALGFLLTFAATLIVTRSRDRRVFLAFYALLLTQQALFNPVFHAGFTVVFGDWSPGTLTALLLFPPLWWHITRLALREDLLTRGAAFAGVAVGGAVHALAVTQQVFGVSP